MPSRSWAPDKHAFRKQIHTTGQNINWYDLKEKKIVIYQES